MKTVLLQTLATGLFCILAADPLAAQVEIAPPPGDAPSTPAPTGGPLAPGVKLDPAPPSPASPDASAPAKNKPFPVSPLIAKILAEKTPEEQESFARHLALAARLIQSNQVLASLEHILEAEAIHADYFALHNLKGAAFSKVRDFEKASSAFARCLELNPDSLEARFNLAEMDFVQKNYEKAYKAFEALLSNNPTMPAPTRSLLRYKNYLCLLLLDRPDDAEAVLKTFRFDSDTPEYYFGNAAKNFHIKDKEEARGWLRSAARVYDRALQTLYLDSIIEIGWIETL